MAGRPPKPRTLKILEGDKPNRIGGEAIPATGPPKKPRGLGKDGGWLWDLVCGEHCDQIDTASLLVLCELWTLLRQAAKAVRADPIDKNVRVAYTSYLAEFNKLASKFGMTPTDRQRLSAPPEAPKDQFETFFGD